ncbi:hypothetical protein TcasGA2_TC033889 [Tribolium castaneum]|uniref:Uncharacterized protein n=1 Tax=Tribolium castaneum TaxID=7070 RepID=A0A139WE91_TRICA|nr:hypothetical protein TcasGA2_TC033889 [Tribolium castaneum]
MNRFENYLIAADIQHPAWKTALLLYYAEARNLSLKCTLFCSRSVKKLPSLSAPFIKQIP